MKQLGQIKIGRYSIQRHLVRGGMADIYLAHDNEEDRVVAIKMVHESAGEYSERFQREARAMAGLVHPHILPAFDYGEYESWYFLVTPYIEYGTLNNRLATGPLSVSEVDPILAQLAEALQFAHGQGIVHRDVKPSNVLMHDGHHVYLADFGLVKRVGQENGLTVTGYLIGTPEYMAPELAEEDATPQSDVYALGVLLYQMLTGRVPFTGNTPMGIFLHHIRDTPERPSALNAAIPAEVEEVILHAMEKDPHNRYQSAQELHLAYQQAVKSTEAGHKAGVVLPPQTLIDRLENIGLPGVISGVKGGKQGGKVRRSMVAAALASVFLLTLGFVVVSSIFFLAGWGNNTRVVDARDTKNSSTPTSAQRTTPEHSVDSNSAGNRSAIGTTDIDATNSVSTTNLYQYPGSSQQNTPVPGKSVQGSASIGENGQGNTITVGNGNDGTVNQGVGAGSSVNGADGQSTGNGGSSNTGSGAGSSFAGGSGSGFVREDGGKGNGKGGGGSTGSGGGGSGPASGSGGKATPSAGGGSATPSAGGSGTPSAGGSGTPSAGGGSATPSAGGGSGTGGTGSGPGGGSATPSAGSGTGGAGTVGK